MGPEPYVEALLERRAAANVAPGMGGPGPPLDHDEFLRWRADADSALRGARVQAESGLHTGLASRRAPRTRTRRAPPASITGSRTARVASPKLSTCSAMPTPSGKACRGERRGGRAARRAAASDRVRARLCADAERNP